MKKYIYCLFACLLLWIGQVEAQYTYQDYAKNWYFPVLLPQSKLGGGELYVSIKNSALHVNFSAGFQTSPLKTGKIVDLLTVPRLPDMELGVIAGSYVAYIQKGALYIRSGGGQELTSVNKAFTIGLSASSNYGNHHEEWDYKDFLARFYAGGGSTVVLDISNDILSLSFSAGFTAVPLKTGKIKELHTIPQLPNMKLGVLIGTYQVSIQDGWLAVEGDGSLQKGFNKSFQINLNDVVDWGENLSSKQNYVYTTEPTVPVKKESGLNGAKSIRNIQYFDGLGRLKQTIGIGQSPNGKDLVQPVVYDEFGREKRSYLPYEASAGNWGAYAGNAVDKNYSSDCEHYKFYHDNDNGIVTDAHPYAEKVFDNSPLNRVMKQGAPGAVWQPGKGHTVRMGFQANGANEVLLWEMNSGGASVGSTRCYKANMLYKTVTKDENWVSGTAHTTEEFTNKQGQMVLKRSYLDDGTRVDTYYVYDDYGLLRYVVPPRAVEVYKGGESGLSSGDGTVVVDQAINLTSADPAVSQYLVQYGASLTLKPGFSFAASDSKSLTISALGRNTELFQELIYCYRYDHRKRMIEKKLPGAAPVCLVYDNRDRLVLTQDGNQRADANKWMYTLYDAFNRTVETGICKPGDTHADLQKLIGASNNYTPANRTAYAYIWYDDYSFAGKLDFDTTVKVSTYSDATGNTNYQDAVKGQVTGTRMKVLEDGKSEWIHTTNYYDSKYRLIQQVSRQYAESASTKDIYRQVVSNVYDFVGNVVTTRESQIVGSSTVAFTKYYRYDAANRLRKVEHQMGTGAKVTLAEMIYDELGQLVQKKIGNGLQTVDYQYNIRGWLTQLNNPESLGSDLFGMRLKYKTGIDDLDAKAQFNGNISAFTWAGSKYSGVRTYGFSYDPLNRLKLARYGEGTDYTTNLDKYKMSVGSYDLNGNIKSLNRYLNGSLMDQLTYTYKGNQLLSVNDAGNANQGFVNGANGSAEYDYDLNGNLKLDKNKGLTKVEYNHLNLPRNVVAGSESIAYIYDAGGTKLAKKVRTATTEEVHYRGSFVYKGSSLDYLIHDEGLIVCNGGNYTYQYYLKDHLGNIRAVFTNNNGSAQLEQEQHYYPFGLTMDGLRYASSTTSKYLYNGKELQDDQLGGKKLDWLDYGARMYDPSLGRWHVIDNKAETYFEKSPYMYSMNNPIRFVDPDGNDGWDVVKGIMAAISDNAALGLTDNRETTSYNNGSHYNIGQDIGDGISMLLGAGEVAGGGTTAGGGAVVTVGTGGVGGGVGVPAMAAGSAIVTHGLAMSGTATANLMKQKGRVSEDGPTDINKLKKGSEGRGLAEKLHKNGGSGGNLPTPETSPDQFGLPKKGEHIHKKTKAVYRESHTTHKSKTGEFKIWKKGTKDFGHTSKTTGKRVTVTLDGKIVGH
jgi:RHS repeat-associated protein